jgi:hypothetical protein
MDWDGDIQADAGTICDAASLWGKPPVWNKPHGLLST